MSTIEIENVGPITSLSIPVPAEGGVVVLQGPNGRGKTTALEAVSALAKGRPPALRDGTKRGRIEGLGVKINVGLSSRRSGELEVQSLEGRLDVSDLVDPGIASPEAADAKRIKALIALSGVECSPDMFAGLVEGGRDKLEEIVPPTKLASPDILELAAAVKRAIETEARQVEGKAETEAGRAKGLFEQVSGIPEQAEHDAETLRLAYEEAVRDHQQLLAQANANARLKAAANAAQVSLDQAQISAPADSVEQIDHRITLAEDDLRVTNESIQELQQELALQIHARDLKQQALVGLRSEKERAEQHAARIDGLRAQIEAAATLHAVTADDIAAAEKRKDAASQACVDGARIRDAWVKRAHAIAATSESQRLRKQAESLRQAAAGTDEILTELVSGLNVPLQVQVIDGRTRLMTTTVRGPTYFADLSAGERWRIALDVAIEAVGPRGLLTIRQEAWEGLDPANRQAICDHVRARGVVLLTAEATGGDEIVPEVQS